MIIEIRINPVNYQASNSRPQLTNQLTRIRAMLTILQRWRFIASSRSGPQFFIIDTWPGRGHDRVQDVLHSARPQRAGCHFGDIVYSFFSLPNINHESFQGCAQPGILPESQQNGWSAILFFLSSFSSSLYLSPPREICFSERMNRVPLLARFDCFHPVDDPVVFQNYIWNG